MMESNTIFERIGGAGFGIQHTLRQLKAIEPGTYLTYRFSDSPAGLFFIPQQELQLVIERFEAYESALAAIRDSDACTGTCADIAAEALTLTPDEALEPDCFELLEPCSNEVELVALEPDEVSSFFDFLELGELLKPEPVDPVDVNDDGTDRSS